MTLYYGQFLELFFYKKIWSIRATSSPWSSNMSFKQYLFVKSFVDSFRDGFLTHTLPMTSEGHYFDFRL